MRNAAVLEQTDHRGQTDGHARRMQEMSVFFFCHGNAFEYQNERAAGGADVDGLIGGVEDQNRRKQSMAISGTVRSRRRKEAGGVPGSWFVFHAQRHKIQSCNVSEFQCLDSISFSKACNVETLIPFP